MPKVLNKEIKEDAIDHAKRDIIGTDQWGLFSV